MIGYHKMDVEIEKHRSLSALGDKKSEFIQFFVENRLEKKNKVVTFAALKNGNLNNLYANYCTISTKRKSHTRQEE